MTYNGVPTFTTYPGSSVTSVVSLSFITTSVHKISGTVTSRPFQRRLSTLGQTTGPTPYMEVPSIPRSSVTRLPTTHTGIYSCHNGPSHTSFFTLFSFSVFGPSDLTNTWVCVWPLEPFHRRPAPKDADFLFDVFSFNGFFDVSLGIEIYPNRIGRRPDIIPWIDTITTRPTDEEDSVYWSFCIVYGMSS